MMFGKPEPTLFVFVCLDIEERWHRQMAEQCEADWLEHERELDVSEGYSLHVTEPDFFEARSLDPYWPPPELEHTEQCEPDSNLERMTQ